MKYKKRICNFIVTFLVGVLVLLSYISVHASTKPGTFKITSPNNSKVYGVTSNIIIKYTKSKNVHHYRVSVSDVTHGEGTDNNVYKTTNNGKKTSFVIDKKKLKVNRKYRVYVSAYGDGNESTKYKTPAKFVEFTVKNIKNTKSVKKVATKPGAFKITSPTNNRKYKGPANITIKYSKAKNVHHYRVSVSDVTHGEGTNNNVYKTTNNGTKTSFNIAKSKLVYGRKYRIYASAYGNANEDTKYKTKAQYVEFNVLDNSKKPGNFKIISPTSNKVYGAPSNVVAKYTSAKYVHHYRVSVYDVTYSNISMEVYHSTNNGKKTTFNIAKGGLVQGHKYRIYVSAYGNADEDAKYKTSATSINFSVKEVPKKTGNFAISSPTNNKQYVEPIDIEVTYSKAANTHHYRYSLWDETNNKVIINAANNLTDTSFIIAKSKLNYNHKYRIDVVAYGDTKQSKEYLTQNSIYFSIKEKYVCKNDNLFANKVSSVRLAGAHQDKDGRSGDSNNNEVYSNNYYSLPWKYVIRANDVNIAERLVYACEYFIDKSKINVGYTQNTGSGNYSRTSLYNAVNNCNGDLTKMKSSETKNGKYVFNADCSSFISACCLYALRGTGKKVSCTSTSYMESVLCNTGMFSIVQYGDIDKTTLKAGDILLTPGQHTEMVISAR